MQELIASLSIAQLAEVYNAIAETPVKKFADKAKGVARLTKELEARGMELYREKGCVMARVSSTEVSETEDTELPSGAEQDGAPMSREEQDALIDACHEPLQSEEAAPVAERRVRRSPMLDRTITIVREKNPKRPGSRTHARYAVYQSGMTGQQFMDICLERGLGSKREILSDLAWDHDQHFIRLA